VSRTSTLTFSCDASTWLDGDESVTQALGEPTTGIVAQILGIVRAAADAEATDDH
jgi:hypothetical protein